MTEIEEAMDELDEEEMTSMRASANNSSELVRRLVLLSRRRDQDPVEKVQDPVEEAESSGRRTRTEAVVQASDGWFKGPMPRKGKDQTFDELVVGLQMNRTYASTQW
jgi:hypothetical protein